MSSMLVRMRGIARPGACLLNTQRRIASSFMSENNDKVVVRTNPFKLHRLEQGPSRDVETSRSELLDMFRTMVTMRRMEITADLLYKQKLIRGFLHLADGQEAIPTGIEAAITLQDSIIQSYRDHITFIGRGGTVKEIMAELLGRVDGAAKGLGGSMHLYKKENNFYGGHGIVGDHVPLGAGLGLAHKYRKDGHVSFTLYGDGAANQGQVHEAYNMAALWDIPVVFIIENNQFGMGTSARRASKNTEFYTRGDYLPGVWVDGMDALAVKSASAFAKQHALEHGPIVLEMDTYRYHGHSISDPGSTYRTRDEIQGIRRARDPIEHVRTLLQEHGLAQPEELKEIENDVKKHVAEETEEAKRSPQPPLCYLWKYVYKKGWGAKLRPVEISHGYIQLPP